jgi:hypothetical protein
VKPEEMLVSVVFGPAVLIASLMSVSQIPTPRAISKDPAKVLEAHEKGEKKKYLGPASSNVVLSPIFVVSTDGLIGKEAKTLLKKLSTLLLISGEVVL